METELSTKWRPERFQEILSIEKSTYYRRLKYLGAKRMRKGR
jgi:transcriptional regulator of acetoin/glycerol metabolism